MIWISIPKFLNPSPGPAIFLLWQSDSCQTPATIINPTLIDPCFYLRNDHTDSCYCRNWKVTPDPGPVFPKFLTPDPGPKEKRRILPESTQVLRIQSHFIDNLWWYWRLCCRVGRLDDLMVFHQSFVTNETVILTCLCRGLLWMML